MTNEEKIEQLEAEIKRLRTFCKDLAIGFAMLDGALHQHIFRPYEGERTVDLTELYRKADEIDSTKFPTN